VDGVPRQRFGKNGTLQRLSEVVLPAAAGRADALGRVWAEDRVPRGRPPRHLHGFHHAWLAASRGAADWRAAVGPVAASGRR
jgi:hypothetical protein